MSAIIFGIDHGNGNIKTEHHVFPCGLVKQAVKPNKVFDQDVLEYNGAYYMLSDTRMPFKPDKTTDLDYYILTLFALKKEAESQKIRLSGKDISLSVGLPPAEYASQANRFRSYFLKNAENGIAFSVNNQSVRCYLKEVYVTPQNYAAVITFQQELVKAYRTVYCIDIGDGTVDLLVLKKGIPDLKVRVSQKSGIGVMRSEIINAIQQDYGYQLDHDIVEQVLMGERTVLPEEIIQQIHQLCKGWVSKIINELHSYVPDFRINPTVFLGGGSVLLKDYLANSADFGKTEFIPDLKANAVGYKVIGEIREKKAGA